MPQRCDHPAVRFDLGLAFSITEVLAAHRAAPVSTVAGRGAGRLYGLVRSHVVPKGINVSGLRLSTPRAFTGLFALRRASRSRRFFPFAPIVPQRCDLYRVILRCERFVFKVGDVGCLARLGAGRRCLLARSGDRLGLDMLWIVAADAGHGTCGVVLSPGVGRSTPVVARRRDHDFIVCKSGCCCRSIGRRKVLSAAVAGIVRDIAVLRTGRIGGFGIAILAVGVSQRLGVRIRCRFNRRAGDLFKNVNISGTTRQSPSIAVGQIIGITATGILQCIRSDCPVVFACRGVYI